MRTPLSTFTSEKRRQSSSGISSNGLGCENPSLSTRISAGGNRLNVARVNRIARRNLAYGPPHLRLRIVPLAAVRFAYIHQQRSQPVQDRKSTRLNSSHLGIS